MKTLGAARRWRVDLILVALCFAFWMLAFGAVFWLGEGGQVAQQQIEDIRR
jgi:hypothetical protein